MEAAADDAVGDITLKKIIAGVIIVILVAQTLMVFLLSVSQGIGNFGWFKQLPFTLDDWNFRILVSATLVQTYYLMRIVVSYLFPPRQR